MIKLSVKICFSIVAQIIKEIYFFKGAKYRIFKFTEKKNYENDDYSKTTFSNFTNFTILKRGNLVD